MPGRRMEVIRGVDGAIFVGVAWLVLQLVLSEVIVRITRVVAILFFLTACDAKDPCSEPLYAGKASDEAWRTLVDAEKQVAIGHARAPVIVEPSEGHVFAADVTPKFSWTSPLRTAENPVVKGGPRLAAAAPPPRHMRPSFRELVTGLFISNAWAHKPPVTSDIYALHITIPGQACPVRALTTDLEWSATDEAATALRAAGGKDLTVQITGAFLRENRIEEGPYRPAAAIGFGVSP